MQVPFKDITKEYEVGEDESVGELNNRVREDLDVYWELVSALQQDGRELSDDAKLGKAKLDPERTLVFARR